jgi:small redox-active disulfide protein 2
MEIKILGKGCSRCQRVEQLTLQAVRELALEANVVHVTDMQAIMAYPIISTPALVINEELKMSGRIPRKEEIVVWLKESQKQ